MLSPTRESDMTNQTEIQIANEAQFKRVCSAMDETAGLIVKAQSYQPKFQDRALIATYEAHLRNLARAVCIYLGHEVVAA
jgi:hypothetical protein